MPIRDLSENEPQERIGSGRPGLSAISRAPLDRLDRASVWPCPRELGRAVRWKHRMTAARTARRGRGTLLLCPFGPLVPGEAKRPKVDSVPKPATVIFKNRPRLGNGPAALVLSCCAGAARESVHGTKLPFPDVRAMSAIEAISEVKYSLRAFRMLTRFGQWAGNFAVLQNCAQDMVS